MKHRSLERLSQSALLEGVARAPIDHFVVWNGAPFGAQANSLRSRALTLITEVWEPVPLRLLLQRAADIAGGFGLDPDAVRAALRSHQTARPTTHILVRRTMSNDYLAVIDVPWPAATAGRPLRAGDLVLDRHRQPFGGLLELAEPAPPTVLRKAGRR